MHDDTALTLARVDRFFVDRVLPATVVDRHALDVTSWQAPGEPVPFAEAVGQQYAPHPAGRPWGPPWSTVWFHVVGAVPDGWPPSGTRAELDVDLGWIAQQPGFQAEGAAWDTRGVLVKGISPRSSWAPVPQAAGASVDLYVEAAANPDVPGGGWSSPTPLGDRSTCGSEPLYRLGAVDVVLVDVTVESLVADVRTLRGLVDVLPVSSNRRAEVVRALEDMCDRVDPDDVRGTAASGRAALAQVLASPAAASAHVVHAIGHAHIDSAWLWPVRETVRKVSRTVANVLALMDTDPDVTFAFSSAQQFAWLEQASPRLFERLRERVREGRIVPVGGMWVESDTNMVGSEAMVRQFLEGKRYFLDRFGVEPTSVWLPDSFGYSGSLPQIARLAGCEDFLTQKLSWNDTNRIPHHTFWWEGIDGSRVFTHFPPVDTYNSDLGAQDLERASAQFAEKGRARTSLAPFGYGDGGGGPTREMVAQAHRTADLEGSPRVVLSTPQAFFDVARAEYEKIAPTWVGELYLELHRGTYTSQARTKQGNRRSEHVLREAELWATTAAVRVGVDYPAAELQELWRLLLLLQFHDILPGSSIAWVHREAEAAHTQIRERAGRVVDQALAALGAGAGVANASPFPRSGIPAGGIGRPEAVPPATVQATGDGFVLDNDAVRVRVDRHGHVTSAVVRATGREVVPRGAVGNVLELARDIPSSWDAWDVERHYQRTVTALVDADVVELVELEDGPAVHVRRSFSRSVVEQWLSLAPGGDPALHIRTRVDWHERRKLLKLGFTLDLLVDEARSEVQFGHVVRPVHDNTSWENAQFETAAHRWVHVAEPDFGVAVVNDSTYGHDISRVRVGPGPGQVAVRVRESLLRAPVFPDPDADQGEHVFQTAVVLGVGVDGAIEHGYDLNLPLRGGGTDVARDRGDQSVAPLVRLSDPGVVVESIKLAADGSGDVVIRVYESRGVRAHTRVLIDLPHRSVHETDLLEREIAEVPGDRDGVTLTLRPFQIRTLRVAQVTDTDRSPA